MNRTFWTALILIVLTGAFSPALWLADFPPEWSTDKGPLIAMLRDMLTAPFGLAALSAALTLPVALAKRQSLQSETKTRPLAVALVLITPAAFFCLQIMMPFMLNDTIASDSVQLFFLGFMTIFFLIVGNYVAIAPFDSRMGFRTRATCSDEVIWARSHRFLGRNLVMMSLIVSPIALQLAGPKPAQWLLVGAAASVKLATYIYARQLAARQQLRNGIKADFTS